MSLEKSYNLKINFPLQMDNATPGDTCSWGKIAIIKKTKQEAILMPRGRNQWYSKSHPQPHQEPVPEHKLTYFSLL